MSTETKRKVRDAEDDRLEVLRGVMPDKGTIKAMRDLTEVLYEAGQKVKAIVRGSPGYNKGRMIAAIDAIQLARDTACNSLLLGQVEQS